MNPVDLTLYLVTDSTYHTEESFLHTLSLIHILVILRQEKSILLIRNVRQNDAHIHACLLYTSHRHGYIQICQRLQAEAGLRRCRCCLRSLASIREIL